MLPIAHIIIGLVFGVILYFAAGFTLVQSLVVFLSSFLIDIDHYIIYVITKKDWNIFRAYQHFKEKLANKERKLLSLCIFHTYEFIAVLAIATMFYEPLSFILLGFLLHIMTDILTNHEGNIKYLFTLSITYRVHKHGKNFHEIEI